MLAARERAELAIDERNQLARDVAGVVADGGGVDVLVAAERGEAVRKDNNHRAHLLFSDEARGALGDVVAEVLPGDVAHPRAGEADEVEKHRKAPQPRALVVVLRRQPHRELAYVRVAERVAFQDLGVMLEHDKRARLAWPSFQHGACILHIQGHSFDTRRKTMLTSGLLFFFLAILAAAFGLSGLADAPIQQAAVWMVCVLCLVLFAFSLRRRTKRPWR